jgi:hypothetical protein
MARRALANAVVDFTHIFNAAPVPHACHALPGLFRAFSEITRTPIMQQADVDRAVARITNESIATIKRYGFSIVEPPADFKFVETDREADSEPITEGVSRELAIY